VPPEKSAVRRSRARQRHWVGGERFLTIKEAAALLRVSRATIYRMIRQKRLLGAFRVGAGSGDWRINAEEMWHGLMRPPDPDDG
jgi:excisionase family DNA binding protein